MQKEDRMLIHVLHVTRPDRRKPFTAAFTTHQHARRTALSVLRRILHEYGSEAQLTPTISHHRALAEFKELTGESRVTVRISKKHIADDQLAPAVPIHDRPVKVVRWMNLSVRL